MIVAIVGANGQLGADLMQAFRQLGESTTALTHADCDITELEAMREILIGLRPDVIVNTAAMHHVENCEKAPRLAYDVNALGPRNLAVISRELDAKLVHVSTDYVFDGLKKEPYLETDPVAPLNVYGSTKRSGEIFVQETAEKYFIVRTSALYGKNPCRAKGGKNFVELMLKLAAERGQVRVVDDEIVSPTPTAELARQIAELSRTDYYGLYHATAEGSCSWYEFAKTIFEIMDLNVRLEVAGPNEFPAKVPRPKFSVLENEMLKKLDLNCLPSWQEGLRTYLTENHQNQQATHTNSFSTN